MSDYVIHHHSNESFEYQWIDTKPVAQFTKNVIRDDGLICTLSYVIWVITFNLVGSFNSLIQIVLQLKKSNQCNIDDGLVFRILFHFVEESVIFET